MKALKLCLVSSALVFSANTNAAILSYGGYTHDTTTDIVTGNGLEWLQWDRTTGETINSIQSQLNIIEGGGWSVATNDQMAHLFNAFDFGLTFDADENTEQSVFTGYQVPDSLSETDELFVKMFGDNISATSGRSCWDNTNCISYTSATFGEDGDADNRYNFALVQDDHINGTGNQQEGIALITNDNRDPAIAYNVVGIALVRDVSAVPVPAAAWLFGSGLLGLIGIAKRKKA